MDRPFANKLINEREVKNSKVGDIVLTKIRDKRSEYLHAIFLEMVRRKYKNLQIDDGLSGVNKKPRFQTEAHQL